MDKTKFPPKASTKNVEKTLTKIIIVLDKILAVIKKIFFRHKSQVHRGKLYKMAKDSTRRSGVEWGR